MNGAGAKEPVFSGYAEVDPTGRYGRYNEVLGKGASKTVFKAFDEYEGIEVAWNQVKLTDFLQRPEELERLYSEIYLLRTLNHSNIIKFYASWVDTANRNINFVTEMFTSGTLRQYRLKHKKVNIRAVKHWCRQILNGLLYLHSLDPPVIHRDLKCDNIFINGNQGQVKIGDLGLAAILRKSYAAHCVGTPEFMAPEVYEEEYNELVDIYSFGMCVLEMVTFEYPYSECTHPAQIYKKVISGKKPDALYKVNDLEVRQFVEKCLANTSCRLSASELLKDPFLQTDGKEYNLRAIDYLRDYDEVDPLIRVPSHDTWPCYGSLTHSCCVGDELDNDIHYEDKKLGTSEIDLFMSTDHGHLADSGITIKGNKAGDGQIFLRFRIADKEGRVRNIYFPFDIENDTALSVATEMVAELDIVEQDVTKIAEMIDGEIAFLVPGWKIGLNLDGEEGTNLDQIRQTSGHTSGRGWFEEITYNVDPSQHPFVHGATAPAASLNQLSLKMDDAIRREEGDPRAPYNSPVGSMTHDDHESRIRNELRWLKAKYQMQLRELRDQQLGSFPGESGCLVKNCATSSGELEKLVNRPHSLLHRAASLPVDAMDG